VLLAAHRAWILTLIAGREQRLGLPTFVAEFRQTASPLQLYHASPYLTKSFDMRDRDDHSNG
jgi:hypothetical protein